MKIAFLNDGAYAYASGAPTAVGGSERDQWLLGASLARFGWSVLVGVRSGLECGERKTIHGVQFVGIGKAQVLNAWYRFLSLERPQWLYWECATHLLGPVVEIAKLVGVRTIFALGFDSEVEPRHALVYRQSWWPLYAWGLRRTDRILAQHHGQISGLRPSLRSKAYVLPKVCILYGVVGDERTSVAHSTRPKYVTWVGMLRHHKRPDVLVQIARKMPEIRFVVCGGITTTMTPPGYGEKIVQELSALENVDYLGQVPPQRAHEIIEQAAVLLCTSEAEGFPNTFVQAWSSGTPIVSLKVDPDGIIQRERLGAISGDVEHAVSDINALMESAERREEIAARARGFVQENYSASAVVGILQRALQAND